MEETKEIVSLTSFFPYVRSILPWENETKNVSLFLRWAASSTRAIYHRDTDQILRANSLVLYRLGSRVEGMQGAGGSSLVPLSREGVDISTTTGLFHRGKKGQQGSQRTPTRVQSEAPDARNYTRTYGSLTMQSHAQHRTCDLRSSCQLCSVNPDFKYHTCI